MYSKILLYGAVGRVHSGLRESNQEDENKKGLGSVFFSFDLSFFGSKAKQDRGVFKDLEPSTGSPRHWNRVRERDSVRPLGLRADELERLTSPWPDDVAAAGNVLGEDEEISSPGSSKKAFLALFLPPFGEGINSRPPGAPS